MEKEFFELIKDPEFCRKAAYATTEDHQDVRALSTRLSGDQPAVAGATEHSGQQSKID